MGVRTFIQEHWSQLKWQNPDAEFVALYQKKKPLEQGAQNRTKEDKYPASTVATAQLLLRSGESQEVNLQNANPKQVLQKVLSAAGVGEEGVELACAEAKKQWDQERPPAEVDDDTTHDDEEDEERSPWVEIDDATRVDEDR